MESTQPTIMIVDDNPTCLKLAEAIVKNLCDCVCVDCGNNAITTFINTFKNNEKKFDAILLDYEMPSKNGLEVLTEIRKFEKKRNISKENQVKIIMTTSYNDRALVHACRAIGCNHYIIKPLTKENLNTRLKSFKLI